MDSTKRWAERTGRRSRYEQEQLRSLDQLRPLRRLGRLHSTVAMHGELDAAALRESLAAFIGRHEIWRTIFPSRDGQPMPAGARRRDGGRGRWRTSADWAGLKRGGGPAAGRDEQAGQHFDLARGPLLRALLVRIGDQEHRLFLSLHRIIADTASLTEVFLPELRELYEAQMQGRPARLDEATSAVRGLRQVADEPDRGTRGPGRTAAVLGEVPGGRADRPGASGRPPAAGAAELPGREAGIRPDDGAQPRAAEVEQAGAGRPVHDADRGL